MLEKVKKNGEYQSIKKVKPKDQISPSSSCYSKPCVSHQRMCGYLLYPLSYSMGVHPDDCFAVGTLIGVKMFATPVMGFYELGQIIQVYI